MYVGFCVWSLFCCAVLSVLSGFAIISLGSTGFKLSSRHQMAVSGLYLFLALPWVGLMCMIEHFLVIPTYFSYTFPTLSGFTVFYTSLVMAVSMFQLTVVSDILLQSVSLDSLSNTFQPFLSFCASKYVCNHNFQLTD